MPNFILKKNSLYPTTFSQIGSTLIPSKTCNNQKVARRYDPDITIGGKTPFNTYVSTSKQIDRPTPLISTDCQSCNILSVPSVTDKTIYPCSSDKYSITFYSNTQNNVDTLGNSVYPRIITSNNQLYQQYQTTDKKNIRIVIPITDTSFKMLIPILGKTENNLELPFYLGNDSFEDAGSKFLTVRQANQLYPGSVIVIQEGDMYYVDISKKLLNYVDEQGKRVNFYGNGLNYPYFLDPDSEIIDWGVSECGYFNSNDNSSLANFNGLLPGIFNLNLHRIPDNVGMTNFLNSSSIETIGLIHSDFSNIKIMNNMFKDCVNILVAPQFPILPNLTNINGMFENCVLLVPKNDNKLIMKGANNIIDFTNFATNSGLCSGTNILDWNSNGLIQVELNPGVYLQKFQVCDNLDEGFIFAIETSETDVNNIELPLYQGSGDFNFESGVTNYIKYVSQLPQASL